MEEEGVPVAFVILINIGLFLIQAQVFQYIYSMKEYTGEIIVDSLSLHPSTQMLYLRFQNDSQRSNWH